MGLRLKFLNPVPVSSSYFALLLLISSSSFAHQCNFLEQLRGGSQPASQNFRYFEPYYGVMVDPPFDVKPGTKVWLLNNTGDGLNGDVYRIVESDGRHYIRKVYRRRWTWSRRRSVRVENDYIRFKELYELNPVLGNNDFKVPYVEKISNRELIIEDLFGTSLRRLLKDSDASLKRRLTQLYELRMESFRKHLEKKYPPVERVDDYISYTVNGEKRYIYLHEGNILVDPETLAMHIIDPI